MTLKLKRPIKIIANTFSKRRREGEEKRKKKKNLKCCCGDEAKMRGIQLGDIKEIELGGHIECRRIVRSRNM